MGICAYQMAATEHNVGYMLSSLSPTIRGNICAGITGLKTKDKLRKRMSIGRTKTKKKVVSSETETTYKAGAF